MKLTQIKILTVLAFALVNGLRAVAQSNGVPGPADYAQFSRFVTERNIFNPDRYARSSPTRPPSYHAHVSRSAPAFTLVGTMSYQKGMFAFFDGNNSDLRKVLAQSGGIAGYTVAEITLAGVKLQSADKKQTVQMKLGETMRQEGNQWLPAGPGEAPASTEESVEAPADGSSSTPSPALEANDILKKLMQQREKELK